MQFTEHNNEIIRKILGLSLFYPYKLYKRWRLAFSNMFRHYGMKHNLPTFYFSLSYKNWWGENPFILSEIKMMLLTVFFALGFYFNIHYKDFLAVNYFFEWNTHFRIFFMNSKVCYSNKLNYNKFPSCKMRKVNQVIFNEQ